MQLGSHEEALLTPDALPCASRHLVDPLTCRELEVLSLVCDGESNRGIARKLSIEPSTVKFHMSRIFAKLGVLRRTQAVALAIHLRLIMPGWLDVPLQNSDDGHGRTQTPRGTA